MKSPTGPPPVFLQARTGSKQQERKDKEFRTSRNLDEGVFDNNDYNSKNVTHLPELNVAANRLGRILGAPVILQNHPKLKQSDSSQHFAALQESSKRPRPNYS
jgi:hypothetical protein